MVAPGISEEVSENQTIFRVIAYMPKQTLLVHQEGSENSSIHDMMWDECIRRAHGRGFMPIGPVWVSDPENVEADTGQTQVQLEEGSRLNVAAFLEGLGAPHAVSVDMCKVTAEVAIGLSV